MGLEANTILTIDGEEFEIKALLETNELIIRGNIKKRFSFSDLADVSAQNGRLCFTKNNSAYALELGKEAAIKWAKKLLAPPKSLFEKLAIKADDAICVFGTIREEQVNLAIAANRTKLITGAKLAFAQVYSKPDIDKLIAKYKSEGIACPIWVIHGKGKNTAPNGNIVREVMRDNGFIDTKIIAISEDWSASRYNFKKASS